MIYLGVVIESEHLRDYLILKPNPLANVPSSCLRTWA